MADFGNDLDAVLPDYRDGGHIAIAQDVHLVAAFGFLGTDLFGNFDYTSFDEHRLAILIGQAHDAHRAGSHHHRNVAFLQWHYRPVHLGFQAGWINQVEPGP